MSGAVAEPMDIDDDVVEPVVGDEIKSGMSQDALLATLKPLDLSDKHKASALNRLKNKTIPGKPQPNTPVVGDCALWTGCQTGGYGLIHVGGKMKKTNRIAFEVSHDVALPPNLQVRHLCANPLCVEIKHMAIGTAQDNANDAVESGRSLTGSNNPNASITAETANAIYANSTGLAEKELAVLHNCSEHIVKQIRTGQRWSSVTGATKRKRSAVKKVELGIKDEKEAKTYIKERIDLIPDEENEQHVHWVWKQSKNAFGYGQARFHGKLYKAHNFAWRVWNQMYKPKKGECVLHGCKMKHCVNPDSLRLGTGKENMADKVRDGTDNRGEKHRRAKLNDGNVLEIRRLVTQGVSQSKLAKQYDVTPSAICNVVSGKRWKHLGQTSSRSSTAVLEKNSSPPW